MAEMQYFLTSEDANWTKIGLVRALILTRRPLLLRGKPRRTRFAPAAPSCWKKKNIFSPMKQRTPKVQVV